MKNKNNLILEKLSSPKTKVLFSTQQLFDRTTERKN